MLSLPSLCTKFSREKEQKETFLKALYAFGLLDAFSSYGAIRRLQYTSSVTILGDFSLIPYLNMKVETRALTILVDQQR